MVVAAQERFHFINRMGLLTEIQNQGSKDRQAYDEYKGNVSVRAGVTQGKLLGRKLILPHTVLISPWDLFVQD